jgi:hypothetical protein
MANPLIVFTTEWRLVPTTCDPCTVCEDIIYGKQYQLHVQRIGATDVILCESCHEVAMKEA